jgi:hypothetical protein
VIERMRGAWVRTRGPSRAVFAVGVVVGAALLAAFLFGLWHVLVGGLVKGNWRAGGFGIALASACGVLLWIDTAVLRFVTGRAERARIGEP